MKKGFAFFISCSGLFFLTLAPIFSTASANTRPSDTAYYFNERGQLLWQQPQAMQPGCFVIRTHKKFQELYHDFLQSDSVTTQGSKPYKPADVQPIPRHVAKRVEKLIREGHVYHPLVRENILEILDKETLHLMRSHIKSSCSFHEDSSDHKEYGGLMKQDGNMTYFAGLAGNPTRFEGSTLYIRGTGTVEYHSHPAGYVETTEQRSSEAVINMVTITGSKTRTNERRYIAYIQGPSRVDQQAVGKRTGYVFGLSSRLIYIYDSEGVKATLPIAFAEKLAPKKMKKGRRAVNTSLAVR
jgi:hypothetical protein